MDAKKWFLTRECTYLNLSNLFNGFGTLLIDGDALLYYLFGNEIQPDANPNESMRPLIDKFLINLSNCGFYSVKIVFFHRISRFTERDYIPILRNVLKNILKPEEFIVFNDWIDNDEWTWFISNQNINLLITSDLDIFNESNVQFKFIEDACKVYHIQIANINGLEFIRHEIFAFLVNYFFF